MDPAGKAHDALHDPLVGCGEGNPIPIPDSPRRLRRLEPPSPPNSRPPPAVPSGSAAVRHQVTIKLQKAL